jgi:hypothetical protein
MNAHLISNIYEFFFHNPLSKNPFCSTWIGQKGKNMKHKLQTDDLSY